MKEFNNFTSIPGKISNNFAKELCDDTLALVLEFLPCSEFKSTASINSVWYTVSDKAWSRVLVYARLAKWKIMLGAALYQEKASAYDKPADLLQAFKNLHDQVIDEIKYYNGNILNCLAKVMAEKTRDTSLLVAILINQAPTMALFIATKFNVPPLNHYLTDELERHLIVVSIRQNGLFLRYASVAHRNDKEVVLAAINENSLALQYASDALKNDKEVVLAAVSKNSRAFQYASAALKNDRAFILAALSKNSFVFQYIPMVFKNDKGFILVTLKQDGYFLHYASTALQNDKEVVLAAVTQNGWALNYASAALQNDKGVVLTAISKNALAFISASASLQKDPDIRVAAGQGSLVDYMRVYATRIANKVRFFLSQCKDFTTVRNPEAYQSSQYGLLLGLTLGFVAGVVGSLLIAGAVVSTLWCVALLAGCMLAGAAIGVTMGSLSDKQLAKQALNITQERKPFLSSWQESGVRKVIAPKKQANLPKCHRYKPFFLPSTPIAQNGPTYPMGHLQVNTYKPRR